MLAQPKGTIMIRSAISLRWLWFQQNERVHYISLWSLTSTQRRRSCFKLNLLQWRWNTYAHDKFFPPMYPRTTHVSIPGLRGMKHPKTDIINAVSSNLYQYPSNYYTDSILTIDSSIGTSGNTFRGSPAKYYALTHLAGSLESLGQLTNHLLACSVGSPMTYCVLSGILDLSDSGNPTDEPKVKGSWYGYKLRIIFDTMV